MKYPLQQLFFFELDGANQQTVRCDGWAGGGDLLCRVGALGREKINSYITMMGKQPLTCGSQNDRVSHVLVSH